MVVPLVVAPRGGPRVSAGEEEEEPEEPPLEDLARSFMVCSVERPLCLSIDSR